MHTINMSCSRSFIKLLFFIIAVAHGTVLQAVKGGGGAKKAAPAPAAAGEGVEKEYTPDTPDLSRLHHMRGFFPWGGGGVDKGSQSLQRLLTKLEYKKCLLASRANLLRWLGGGITQVDDLDHLENLIKDRPHLSEVEIKNIRRAYNSVLENTYGLQSLEITPAIIIARGLAGEKNWEALEGADIKNIPEGIWNGMAIRSAQALGDVLSIRIKEALENVVGTACDGVIDSVVKVGNFVNNNLFHDGYKPFSLENVKTLRSFVRASFDDIDRLLRDGLRDSLRGYDMPPRPSGDQKQAGSQSPTNTRPLDILTDTQVQQQEATHTNPIDPWRMLMAAYIEQFARFIAEINQCKGYYQEDQMIVFYAEQIQQQLENLGRLLAKAKTLPELDELFGSSKVLVGAIKQNVDRLFLGLEDLIRPRSQKDTSLGSSYDLRGSGKDTTPKRDDLSLGLGNSPWTGAAL